jgi:hypothetical protein
VLLGLSSRPEWLTCVVTRSTDCEHVQGVDKSALNRVKACTTPTQFLFTTNLAVETYWNPASRRGEPHRGLEKDEYANREGDAQSRKSSRQQGVSHDSRMMLSFSIARKSPDQVQDYVISYPSGKDAQDMHRKSSHQSIKISFVLERQVKQVFSVLSL